MNTTVLVEPQPHEQPKYKLVVFGKCQNQTSRRQAALTHLYCMVSEVVDALSLVMRILTMLKRKTKFICAEARRGTIISGSFVIASCTYTQFPAAGTLIMSGRGRGAGLSSSWKNRVAFDGI